MAEITDGDSLKPREVTDNSRPMEAELLSHGRQRFRRRMAAENSRCDVTRDDYEGAKNNEGDKKQRNEGEHNATSD